MHLTLFGRSRKVKTPPTTVLELIIESEVDVRHEGNNRFELIIRPKSIPEVILQNKNGSTEHATLWHWHIGAFWYSDTRKLWIADLSMTTGLYNKERMLIAAGSFDSRGNRIETCCALVDGQRLRFHRVNLDTFKNSPIQFYPEIRVRIRDHETRPARR